MFRIVSSWPRIEPTLFLTLWSFLEFSQWIKLSSLFRVIIILTRIPNDKVVVSNQIRNLEVDGLNFHSGLNHRWCHNFWFQVLLDFSFGLGNQWRSPPFFSFSTPLIIIILLSFRQFLWTVCSFLSTFNRLFTNFCEFTKNLGTNIQTSRFKPSPICLLSERRRHQQPEPGFARTLHEGGLPWKSLS